MVGESLRNRSFDVYAKSEEEAERWRQAADDADMSLSRWFRTLARQHLAEPDEPDHDPEEMKRRIDELERETNRLRLTIEDKNDRIRTLENRIAEVQDDDTPLLNDEVRERAVDVLRDHRTRDGEPKPMRAQVLAAQLGLETQNELTRLLNTLWVLQQKQVIERAPTGWRWAE